MQLSVPMENLFSDIEKEAIASVAPLAVRMRPRTLDEFVGQPEVLRSDGWLYRAIKGDTLTSIILYGPAGCGKTSLAHVIANTTHAQFVEVSAIGGTVSDLRREIASAKRRLIDLGKRTILFVDEIHRFTKSQQDALLHAVENRVVVLIGATTENPYFEVNSALNSRSRIITLCALGDADISQLIDKALKDPRGLCGKFSITKDALDCIVKSSAGDARCALNTLELASELSKNKQIKKQDVLDVAPRTKLAYDKNDDQHYDVVSAFIKSMRGSDADAALYWLARMIDGGEDPRFIARRMLICASEDVGNADPQALLVAHAAFKSAEVIGYPECRINLAQAATYIALAPKSNSCEAGIDAALREVRRGPARSVPAPLRDRHRPDSQTYGEYKYPHNYSAGWVDQQYLPDGLERGCFYCPSERGWEAYRSQIVQRDRQTGA